MPNYNYRTNDYMRRNQCSRPMPLNMPSAKVDSECSMCTETHTDNYCTHDLLSGMPIAMAYVPWQEWRNLYSAEKALCRGTIFEELDKPFCGIGGCQK